jgi:hypothetical protein
MSGISPIIATIARRATEEEQPNHGFLSMICTVVMASCPGNPPILDGHDQRTSPTETHPDKGEEHRRGPSYSIGTYTLRT